MNEQKISLLFSGDFAPLLNLEEIRNNHFSELDSLIETCDLHITNLECPLTLSENQIEKSGPPVKAHPANIELLKQAKVSIACMANNHIFDYQEQGILDTIDICSKNNIETLGIVSRPDGKPHWLIKEIKNKRIGFLNYCEHEFSVREPGLLGACGYDAINAFYDIQELRPRVDYLIVIYHGGNEYYPLPNPQIKKDFHYLADLGADTVIGHHTHVFSGYEIYKRKPLVYSLGNFFFPYPDEPDEGHNGLVCELTLSQGISIELIPIIQCKNYIDVRLAIEELRDSLIKRIEDLSAIIADNQKLREKWSHFYKENGRGLSAVFLHSNRIERKLGKIFPNSRLFKDDPKRIRILTNVIRCSSLKHLVLDTFNVKK